MDNMFEKTKAFCDSFLELSMPGFDLAVYHEGKCVLRYMNGYSDLENKIEMNGNERYNIYSCSKVITGVAAMQLWDMGMFDLEDRLTDSTKKNLEMRVEAENGATLGKFELAKMAKELGLDA